MEERDILLMAALIAAVRTARFEDREFEGMSSPRMRTQIRNSIWLAHELCRLSSKRYPAPPAHTAL